MTDMPFDVIMRWMHIASMATLIGGLLYARLVMAPTIATLAPDARESLASAAAVRFRPFVFAAIGGLVVSGIYKLLTTPGHRPIYHIDRKSTRLNSSHLVISYAVFCLK